MASDFVHLHVHTAFSLLDGAIKVPDLMAKAERDGQDALAITDHGNLHGALEFYGKAKAAGKWPHDERSKFRPGSSYDTCFSILAAHKDGLPRSRLVELLAEATGKTAKLAGYDAQVVLSAWGNEEGLSRNDGPRHRSCRPGFWVKRANGHVTLMVD